MYRFGEFELDVATRQLRRAGAPVRLEPQAFDLLVCLIEHRDRVIPKPELLDGVWGHRFLSEASLTTRVKEVRRAVGDDGTRQHTVANIRGRGYRFVASVETVDPPAPVVRFPDRTDDRVLVGRDRELAALDDALARAVVVTLTGPGGVGKSTLARAALARTRASFPAGAHFVELASVGANESVLPAVARTLDIVVDARRPADAIASIARLDALLVLDNCEHVVDNVGAVVDALRSVVEAEVRILATSRVPLGLSPELVVPVQPLTIDAAGDLFVERCRAVTPSWDPGEVEVEALHGLVAGLDRLPLTIEMAAARAGSMTFDELSRAIAEGSPLLQVSHRAPAHRHRSLESLVVWSAGLLDARHRDLFERFSVFAGDVTVEDAAPVLAPTESSGVIFDLAALAERSLLVVDASDATSRFSMLVTVRTVAERWLEESGRGEELRQRHAEHFLAVARDVDDAIRTPAEAEARRRFDGVVDEVRAAHRWARAHRPALAYELSEALFHVAYSSLWDEPAAWSRELLASRPNPDGASSAGASVMAAGAAAHSGDLEAARRQLETVLATAGGRTRAIALEVLADVALYEGDLDGALRAADELRQLGEELDDAHARAFAAVDVSLARTYGGDPSAAVAGLAAFGDDGLAPTDRAWLALARGDALSAMRAHDASSAFGEAIELGATVGNRFVVSCARTSLATEHARVGEVRLALDAYAGALADFQRHGNTTHAVTAMRNLIGFLADLGDDRGALTIAGAVSDERLRVSYGAEAERIAGVLEDIERRIDPSRYSAWLEQGRLLDVDRAVRTAAELVDRHRL